MTRSPWRYPGGKARHASGILPFIPSDMTGYCEPFVGGGGVLIPLLDAMLAEVPVTINDADLRVSGWWEVMAGDDEDAFRGLLSMVRETRPTVEAFNHIQKLSFHPSLLPRAFAGIFLNRCAYNGILSGGPIGGQEQRSRYTVDCRWKPDQQVAAHLKVRDLLSRHPVTVSAADFREVITDTNESTFIYADPPYLARSARLYPCTFDEQDHDDLSKMLLSRDNWLLSYDDHPWVRQRYADCAIVDLDVRYTSRGPRRDNELLIFPRRVDPDLS